MIPNNAVYIFMGKKTYWTPSLNNPLPRQKWSEVTSEMHLPTPPPEHNPDSKSYDAVSANVMIWVLQMGESESGQMVSEKVK